MATKILLEKKRRKIEVDGDGLHTVYNLGSF
jgi:hypothetical protein